MRIKALSFLSNNAYVGAGKCTKLTHDIERLSDEGGFLVRCRATSELFFVPDGVAIATLEPESEVTDDDAAPELAPAPRARRGRPPEAA